MENSNEIKLQLEQSDVSKRLVQDAISMDSDFILFVPDSDLNFLKNTPKPTTTSTID